MAVTESGATKAPVAGGCVTRGPPSCMTMTSIVTARPAHSNLDLKRVMLYQVDRHVDIPTRGLGVGTRVVRCFDNVQRLVAVNARETYIQSCLQEVATTSC